MSNANELIEKIVTEMFTWEDIKELEKIQIKMVQKILEKHLTPAVPTEDVEWIEKARKDYMEIIQSTVTTSLWAFTRAILDNIPPVQVKDEVEIVKPIYCNSWFQPNRQECKCWYKLNLLWDNYCWWCWAKIKRID